MASADCQSSLRCINQACSEARGGQAIICDVTERAAAPQAQVGFKRLPAMTVKGVAREVEVFELTEEHG